jgi:hypothetical protein
LALAIKSTKQSDPTHVIGLKGVPYFAAETRSEAPHPTTPGE